MMMADYFLYYRVGVQVPRNATHVHVHSSVTFIHSYGWEGQWIEAFNQCKSLVQVILHDGIQAIREFVFAGCLALPCIVIPPSISTIGNGHFGNAQH